MCDLCWQKTWLIRAVNWCNCITTFSLFISRDVNQSPRSANSLVSQSCSGLSQGPDTSALFAVLLETWEKIHPSSLKPCGPLLCSSRLRWSCARTWHCSALWGGEGAAQCYPGRWFPSHLCIACENTEIPDIIKDAPTHSLFLAEMTHMHWQQDKLFPEK